MCSLLLSLELKSVNTQISMYYQDITRITMTNCQNLELLHTKYQLNASVYDYLQTLSG
jgi:hypothetical protein